MSGLGHILEGAGVATVVIGLVPQHVATIRPPRALLVPFEMGRPMGAPGNIQVQQDVLNAALALLDREGPGPIMETFAADSPAGPSEDAWACPVSFPTPASDSAAADRLREETRLLMPWFDRGRKTRGHTAADASGLEVDRIAIWLAQLLEGAPSDTSPVADRPLAETFKLAVEDLKAFYLEAATAQPNPGTVAEVNNWFWDETFAGELLRDLRDRLKDHPDGEVRMHAAFTLVPQAQIHRREATKND